MVRPASHALRCCADYTAAEVGSPKRLRKIKPKQQYRAITVIGRR